MTWPLRVMTKPRVMAESGPNASVTACETSAESTPVQSVFLGSTSPMGHGVVAAGGRLDFTMLGVKCTESSPIGSGTHPCEP